jgi:hypothetical protein
MTTTLFNLDHVVYVEDMGKAVEQDVLESFSVLDSICFLNPEDSSQNYQMLQ